MRERRRCRCRCVGATTFLRIRFETKKSERKKWKAEVSNLNPIWVSRICRLKSETLIHVFVFLLRFLVFYLRLSVQGCARKASTKWIPVLDIGGSGNQIQHPWAMCNCTTVLSRHLNTNKPHNHLCHLSYIPDSATKRLSESFRMNHTQNPGGLGLVSE